MTPGETMIAISVCVFVVLFILLSRGEYDDRQT
jgi:preprotein translocase subunit SecG